MSLYAVYMDNVNMYNIVSHELEVNMGVKLDIMGLKKIADDYRDYCDNVEPITLFSYVNHVLDYDTIKEME